jgi:eukaryotic-like serine/threonine-protein kinase
MVPRRWLSLQPHLDQVLDANTQAHAEKALELGAADPELAAEFEQVAAQIRAAQAENFLANSQSATLNLKMALAGRELGNYTLVEAIADGGMGQVWLARATQDPNAAAVAIKLLAQSAMSPVHLERFQREAQTLATLRHPHIARFIGAGVSSWDQPYLVMEHVQGLSIDAGMDVGQLSVRARIERFLTLLDAVQHAHQHLVVHRDIKPANVMLSSEGAIKLLDFGIAKLLSDDPVAATVTARAHAMLTPGYAAPEQWLGQPVTMATDVFALGVLLYLLLTGKHPLLSGLQSAAQVEQATLNQVPARMSLASIEPAAARCRASSVSALKLQLRGDLDRVVSKAIDRDVSQRYANVADFANDLRRYLEHRPVLARAPRWHYLLGKFSRRHRIGLTLGGVASVALVALGTHAVQQRQQAQISQLRMTTTEGLLHSMFRGMSPDVAAKRTFTARELLGRVERHLNQTPEANPAARAAVQIRLADMYVEVGAYEAAAATFRLAGAGAEKAEDLGLQAEALHKLVDAQLKLNQAGKAEEALVRLEELLAQNPSLGQPLRTIALMLRGEWHWQHQQYAQADKVLEKAMQSSNGQADGPRSSLEVQARILYARGVIATYLGRPREALELLTQADQAQARRGEWGVTDRLNMVRDFAQAEVWLGHYEAAARRLEPALAELDERLGADHLVPTRAASVLLTAALRQGQFERAGVLAARLLQHAGPGREGIGSFARQSQARIAMYAGDAAKAEAFFRQLLAELDSQTNGKDNGPNAYAEPLRRIHGEALLRLGRTREALAVLETTLANQTALAGADHNTVAATHVLLACALARTGERKAANALWKKSYSVLLRDLGEQHPFVLVAQANLALSDSLAGSPVPERMALADRVERELGWQQGGKQLASWLRLAPTEWTESQWAQWPVVL